MEVSVVFDSQCAGHTDNLRLLSRPLQMLLGPEVLLHILWEMVDDLVNCNLVSLKGLHGHVDGLRLGIGVSPLWALRFPMSWTAADAAGAVGNAVCQ